MDLKNKIHNVEVLGMGLGGGIGGKNHTFLDGTAACQHIPNVQQHMLNVQQHIPNVQQHMLSVQQHIPMVQQHIWST